MSARGKYLRRPVVYGPTPGPWSAGLTNTKIVVDDSRGGRLATLAIVPQSVHVAEGVATAVLMAAAPEMYEALEAQVAVSRRLMEKAGFSEASIRDCTAQARRALTRARGPS